MALGLGAISAVSVWTLRSILDQEINASILNVASIQAASVTDAPSGEMHFHEWELTPDEAASVRDLIRYAQIWDADGRSLLRSQFMTEDLPLDTAHLQRAADGELVWADHRFQGVPVRTLYYPLERLGAAHAHHVLQVAGSLGARDQLLTRVIGFLAVLCGALTVATFLGARWLADRAVRPVHEVIDQAEDMGAGSLDRRIRAYADTQEYRRLVDVLNTMLGRLQQAFEAQRRFTADASHELRSPLTVMKGELELALRRERSTNEYREVLASTLEEVNRLSRISEDLLVLARSDSGALRARPEETDAADVATRVLDRLEVRAGEKGVHLALESSTQTWAVVDPSLLGQVVWNLVDNAIRYSPPGGTVEVEVRDDRGDLELTVSDGGPGFTGDPERAFDRFSRADEARTHTGEGAESTGLGLAIVKAVAEAHSGTVRADNRPEGGARVTVRIPGGSSGGRTTPTASSRGLRPVKLSSS